MMSKKTEKPKEQKRANSKGDEPDKLRGEIEQLQKEKDELFEKLQRVSADYANYQKRAPKQIADFSRQLATLIDSGIPLLASLNIIKQSSEQRNMQIFLRPLINWSR